MVAVQKKVEEPVAAAEPVAEVAVEAPVSAESVVGKKEGTGVSIEEETERVIKIGDVEVDNSRDFKIEVDRDEGRVAQELRKKGGKGRKDSMTTPQEPQDDSKQQLENMRRKHEEAAAKKQQEASKQQEAKHMDRTRGKIPQQAVDPSKVSTPQFGGRRGEMGHGTGLGEGR